MNTSRLSYIRRAVTLIEVVFSIGVVLIGLLGLLSILPLAGRRAQDSISLSVGPVIGQQAIHRLEAEHYLSSGRFRPITYPGLPAPTNLTPATAGSFCIDPMFASFNTPPSSAIANGYSAAFFPYYKTNHNPLSDPSTNSTTWSGSQPRLKRVGITRATALATFIEQSEALELAESSDDLIVSLPEDKTLDANFKDAELAAVSSGLEYGARIPKGDFTWFATVNPLPGGVYASLSVVVMRKRQRSFDTPTATTAPEIPEGNAVGERLAYVTYASGFNGGAGGTVHLVSAANTVSRISSDDWVMLSRFDIKNEEDADPSNDISIPIHRWYRVVGVNGKAERFTTDGTTSADDSNLGARLPAGASDVWRHKLLLDGPDWYFEFREENLPSTIPKTYTFRDYADSIFTDNTYATIVSDVVSVTERVVLVTDL